MSRRTRAYLEESDAEVDTPITGRAKFGCNCFAAGDPGFAECVVPNAWKNILAFFKVAADTPGYEDLEVIIEEETDGIVDLDDVEYVA